MSSVLPPPSPIDFGWGEALSSGTYTFLAIGIATVPVDLQESPEAPVNLRKTIDRIAQVSQENGSVVFASNLPRCQVVLAYSSAWQAIQTIHSYYEDPSADLISIGLCVGATFDGDDPSTCVPLLKSQSLADLALGGQVLLSASTFEVLRDGAPVEWEFEDLGTIHLDYQMRRERVIQLLHPLLPSIRAFLTTEERVRPALPHRFGLLIGRDGLVDDVIGRLTRYPIVTLTGPAGIGKSHIASKVAYELQSSDEDVVWVTLTGVVQEEKFYEQIALALGLRGKNFPLKNLILRQLSGRSVRFVLDGCENCQGIAKEFVTEATRASTGPSFLVTSNKRLGIDLEEHVLVGLLPNPAIDVLWSEDDLEEHPSTSLFMDRAKEVRLDFHVEKTEAQAIAKICNHFNGHPLSILLAAKRVGHLSPSQILFELTAIKGRVSGRRNSASKSTRHDSLLLAFEWTYTTLSPEAQHLAKSLVPIKGRWQKVTAAALADVSEEKVREPLAELVDSGFVVVDREIIYGDYYKLSASFAGYLDSKFQSEDDRLEAFERHCIIHLQLLAKLGQELGGEDEVAAMDKFEEYKQDILDAFEFTLRTGYEINTFTEALIKSWQYWYSRNHIQDGLRLIDLAVKRYKGPVNLDLGRLLSFGSALSTKGALPDKSIKYLNRALLVAREVKNNRFFMVVHGNYGFHYWSTSQFDKSIRAYEIAETFLNEDASVSNVANVYTSWFTSLLDAGRYTEAETIIEKALSVQKNSSDRQLKWILTIARGQLLFRKHCLEEAYTFFEEAFNLAHELKDMASVARSIYWLAEYYSSTDRLESAAQLIGAILATVKSANVVLYPINQERLNQLSLRCDTVLSTNEFKKAKVIGAFLSKQDILDMKLE